MSPAMAARRDAMRDMADVFAVHCPHCDKRMSERKLVIHLTEVIGNRVCSRIENGNY
jgi:hypothetical protein